MKKAISETFKRFVDSPAFKKGQEDYKQGKFGIINKNMFWVKKLIGKREWNGSYRYNNSYCYLGEVKDKIAAGFCVAGEILPTGLEVLSLEEERQVDDYRRSQNVRPFVFKVI